MNYIYIYIYIMIQTILDNDELFIKYQLEHYFQKYNNISTKYCYVNAINEYINEVKKQPNNFFWIEKEEMVLKINVKYFFQ